MALEIKIPAVGESITEVTIAEWLVEDGEYVELDQVLCELESDKATLELPSEAAGTVKILVEAGTDVEIGTVVCEIDTDAKAPAKAAKKEATVAAAATEEKAPVKEEKKPEPAKKAPEPVAKASTGSFKAGHPSEAADNDVRMIDTKLGKPSSNGTAAASSVNIKAGSFSRDTNAEKMSNLRKTISKRLVAAKNDTAMLTTFNEVDMGPVMEIRNKYKDQFKETHGINLGFMSFFTKAACIALMEAPAVNGIIEDNNIIYHDYCDVGVAVSTPKGLVVPVIRNAESLSMAQIEQAVMDLAVKGRDGKLTIDEMTGGTFTISNGGVFGSLMSTPILNAPQSAILGLHKIQERPMAENGQVVIKKMMYLALSYDHRIIDGKEAVTFLVRIKELLESPEQLLFGTDPLKRLLELG